MGIRSKNYDDHILGIKIACYILLLGFWYFRKQIDYRILAILYSLALYICAVLGYSYWGLLSNGGISYLMIIFLNALVFGLWGGIFSLLIIGVSHLLFTFAYTQGSLSYCFDLSNYVIDFNAWVTEGSIILFTAFIFIGPVLLFYHELFEQIKALRQSNQALLKEIECREKVEKDLKDAWHMGALGTLSGRIAHDFNNILTPILGYALLLQQKMGQDFSLREEIDHIVNAARRAKDLIEAILSYSYKKKEGKELVVWNELIQETVSFVQKMIPPNITIHTELVGDSFLIRGDSSQLQQVLINVLNNASQAIGMGQGRIRLSLKKVSSNEIRKVVGGNACLLEISDTGSGIDSSHLAKVFDPFFTTKEPGIGTGFGLAMVKQTVESLGGMVEIKSSPEGGTVVRILLPVQESDSIEKGPQRERAPEPEEFDLPAKVLLVDDEEPILNYQQSLLKGLGCETATFKSPIKALEFFCLEPNSFDLAIIDLMMFEMDGYMLSKVLHEANSRLAIVLCSGSFSGSDPDTLTSVDIDALLEKPFDELTLRQTLDQAIRVRKKKIE